MAFRAVLVAALVGVVAAGIYPEGHFDHVIKLTNDNFDEEVKKAVDGDHTLMSPKWNEVTKIFKDNPDVVFGDISLSDGGPRGGPTASPGAGGWPTIRYYNKQTGVDGQSYTKKTSMAMCDELGPKGDVYMQQYVEEAAGVSLCPIDPPHDGCSDKEKTFIGKLVGKTKDFFEKQVTRLSKMKGEKMKDDLRQWLNQRLAILKQFVKKDASATDSHADEL